MNRTPRPAGRRGATHTGVVLTASAALFIGLGILFATGAWGRIAPAAPAAPVDRKFLDATPLRKTYADLARAREDLSDYDCYTCHEKNKPPPIRFDANHRIIIPKEHANITMAHGSHERSNLCYHCHNEQNLLTLQGNDRRELKFDNVPALCGTCHGPVFRDWETGVHGRTGGFWDHRLGTGVRLSCANCHDPHAPRFAGIAPAPGPQPPRGSVPSAPARTAR